MTSYPKSPRTTGNKADVQLDCQALDHQEIEIIFSIQYPKIRKISPGAYIFQRPFLRGLHSEGLIYGGKFAFQNRLGYNSLIVGRKLTVFPLYFFIFRANPSTRPLGAYIWRGVFNRGFFFLRYKFGRLIHIWRGLFSEFYCISSNKGPRCIQGPPPNKRPRPRSQ